MYCIDVYTCLAVSCAITTHLINPISSYGGFKYLKMLRLVENWLRLVEHMVAVS